MEHGDRVGEPHHDLHVVLDDQDGQVRRQPADQIDRAPGLRGAHPRRRLVQAEEHRLRGEGDADLEVPLLAVREVRGELRLLPTEPDGVEDRPRAVDQVAVRAVVPVDGPGVAPRLHGDAHVLEGARAGQDVRHLVGAGDRLPGDRVRRQARDILAVEDDAAARRPQHAGQAVEEGALAGAVRSDERAHLAPADGEAHPVERGEAAEPHREALRPQQGAVRRRGAARAHPRLGERARRRQHRLLPRDPGQDVVSAVVDAEDELVDEGLVVLPAELLVALREVVPGPDLHAL